MRAWLGAALILTLGGASPASAAQEPADQTGSSVKILAPFDGTLFPSDIRAPEFRWDDSDAKHKVWLLRFEFADAQSGLEAFSEEKRWSPPREVWERIKAASLEKPARLYVYGLGSRDLPLKGRASIRFTTSRDPVGAPVFFRAVPQSFPPARLYGRVKWKLGWISSYEPPATVMQNQRLCLNCHMMSSNGKTLGFEANSRGKNGNEERGGYLVYQDPGRKVVWTRENFFDWNEAATPEERKNPGLQGFLSIASPDGLFIVSSGRALTSATFFACHDWVAGQPGPSCRGIYDFQLLTKGILLTYSLKDKKIRALPGADDIRFVHGPTSWSPDGKTIYFFRAPITSFYEKLNQAEMPREASQPYINMLAKGAPGVREVDKHFDLKYDLYSIPWNDGKGGTPVPVEGASRNGRSNYGGRISPDGKWIVFTQSANGALFLRPDSELYIIPVGGGKPRRLKCNRPGGNSWHSWSPNGRWLVFSSRAHGPKTDMVLTHIDENGDDSPPLVLTQMRDPGGLAVNLPEFFNIKPGQLETLEPRLHGAMPPAP